MTEKPFLPMPVTDAQIAFGVGYSHYPEVPAEWRSCWGIKLFSDMFFAGVEDLKLMAVDGIDPELAWRHISACMRSWETKHEHKTAAVGYMLELWFGPETTWTVKPRV